MSISFWYRGQQVVQVIVEKDIQSIKEGIRYQINNLLVSWLLLPSALSQISSHWKQLQPKQSWWHQHEQIYPLTLHLTFSVKQILQIRIESSNAWIVLTETSHISYEDQFSQQYKRNTKVQTANRIPSSSSLIVWYGVFGSVIFSLSGLFDSMSFKFSSSHLTRPLEHTDVVTICCIKRLYWTKLETWYLPCSFGFRSLHC